MVDDSPGGENHRKSVDHQSGVEVLKIARTDHYGGNKKSGPKSGPRPGTHTLKATGVRQLYGTLPGHEDPGVQEPQRQSYEGQHHEGGPTDAQTIAKNSEQKRRKEAAEPAHGAHQAGDGSGLRGEILRNELEYSAVA